MSRRTADSNKAISVAWENEQQRVSEGKGTRDWTPEQQQDILERGKAYDDSLAGRSGAVKNLFFDSERRYIHEEIGSNFRMTNIQAAIGCAQLEKLDITFQI